jgi:membrane-bound serine protease (ClpP class)
LILFGLGLLVLEVKVPSFGALGIGGAISLFVGSLMVTRSVPGVHVGLGVLLPSVLVLCLGVLLLGRLALAAQRQPPATGVETLIGQQALARSAIGAGGRGQVAIHGELWQAESDVPVEAGEFVRVIQVNGLTFKVVPDRSRTPPGDIAWKA